MQSSEDPVERLSPKSSDQQRFRQFREMEDLRERILEELSKEEGNLFTYFLEEAKEELQDLFAEENYVAFLKFVKEKAILAARLEKEEVLSDESVQST